MDTLKLTQPSDDPYGSSGWDLMVDEVGNIAVDKTPRAFAQDAASECRLFAGEAYYETTRGIPYWEQILGHAPPLALYRAYLKRAAFLVPGIVSVSVFFTAFNHRHLSGQVQVTDKSGNKVAAGF